jgi:hypothetical protein
MSKGSKEYAKAVVKTKEKLAEHVKKHPTKTFVGNKKRVVHKTWLKRVDWKNEAKTLYKVLQGLLNYELPQHLKDDKDVHGSSRAYYHELCGIREKIMTEMLRSNSRTDGKIKK